MENVKKFTSFIKNRLVSEKFVGLSISIILNSVLWMIMVVNYTRAGFFYSSSTDLQSVMKDAANITCVVSAANLLIALIVDILLKNENLFVYYAVACINVSIAVTIFVRSSLSCHISEYVEVIIRNLIFFWSAVVFGRLLVMLVFYILNSKKHRLIVISAISLVFIVVSVLCYIKRDKDIGTLVFNGKNISNLFAVIIPFQYIIFKDIRNYEIWQSLKDIGMFKFISKWLFFKPLPFLAIATSVMVLFKSKESGILIMSFISICIYTLLMTTNSLTFNKILKWVCGFLFVVAVIVAVIFSQRGLRFLDFGDNSQDSIPIPQNIIEEYEQKMAERVTGMNSDGGQIKDSQILIAQSGLFGNVNFHSLYAGEYEYVFACTLRYMGYLSGIILFILLILAIIYYECHWDIADNLENSTRNLFFIIIVITTCYSWLSNLSILPLAGVNAPFTGITSRTSIISFGLMLSILLTPKSAYEKAKEILHKLYELIKGESFDDGTERV